MKSRAQPVSPGQPTTRPTASSYLTLKLAANYLAVVQLASIRLWLRPHPSLILGPVRSPGVSLAHHLWAARNGDAPMITFAETELRLAECKAVADDPAISRRRATAAMAVCRALNQVTRALHYYEAVVIDEDDELSL
jgi:hypothetical protein